ncbi:hybrid sensor histidine kinase/response regulator [Pseudogracilibacillus auburnensis]|uniref:hybrid sensor histidine kinase/response regulator n=1 Tax=Pseudogracilibacillus auburnensis TaxID=1494959 RepID=UPI001A96286E|nr:ATP-binding protein [Pseudogracilibacillus auburnensis]MBO1005716.1 response regulator [Pseudogracilibacillus auburnensis]
MFNFKGHKWKHVYVIIFILVFLTAFRLLWLVYHFPPEQPPVSDGVLDLRGYELHEKRTITLDGEWSFYPENFIDPQLTEKAFSNIPWKKVIVPSSDSSMTPVRFGTYRLRILLDEIQMTGHQFGIRIPSTKTASALYINGILEAESGNVADNNWQHKGKDIPNSVYFTSEQHEIDIILHLSNFDTPESIGINKTIKFGTAEAVQYEQNVMKNLIASIVVILIIHSLYTILIYIFIYRNKIMLFFTIGFLLPALDEVITYDKSIIGWLNLDYDWSLKLFNLIYLGASFFFVQFMRVLLTKHHKSILFKWYTVLYILSALSIMIMPIHYLLPANTVFFVLYFVSFITVVIFSLKEYIENQKESFFLAFVALSTTSGIIWGLIKALAKIEIPFYPFDYAFAFLGFAAFWFRRFYERDQQVNELVDELKKADKLKDNFLTNSSNKLWNPLNMMIAIAQTIYDRKSSPVSPEEKTDLKNLIDTGRGMSIVLNDLVDFTRLKEGTIQIYLKSINIHTIIPGVFDMLRIFADEKRIKMRSMISANFPNVIADENRLIQILYNLLHNAIKYSDGGEVILYAEIQKNSAVIHVQDHGRGIDEDTQKRIMAPYEQGTLFDEGIGLGLTICKILIELHGGTINVNSAPHQGSIVSFTLPVAETISIEDDSQNILLETAATTYDNKNTDEQENRSFKEKFHILAIDDDPVTLKLISNIFPLDQYEVSTVSSGSEALPLLKRVEWDLIISDTMMPNISGYELTSLIRQQYSALELPIILLSVRGHPDDISTVFAMGANDYVTKPINSLELKARGKALIDLKHSINERLHMEAAWLQAQIQPHFLFNTINTIASLSTIDSERMVDLLNKFGEYLRGSFDSDNLKRTVPLNHELELVRSYLYIEKERFGDRLQIQWDIDEDVIIDIPPLSIQPLVENAVRHGVLKKITGGTIWIRIKKQEEFILVSIKDNGIGMAEELLSQVLDDSTERSGIGLPNTSRRLQRIFGDGLNIYSSPNQGTEVSFKIPKKE